MAVIVLFRHGQSSANAAGVLAGRAPGVELTEAGIADLRATAGLLPALDYRRLLHSPLHRCVHTAELLAEEVSLPAPAPCAELVEVDYGDWTGRKLADLVKDPVWPTIATTPSRLRFAAGESIAEAAARAVAAVARIVAELDAEAAEAPPRPAAVLVSHGDIIKAVLADALGMPLDDFQRLAVAPGSFSVIYYAGEHATVLSTCVAGRADSSGKAMSGKGAAGGTRTGQAGVLGGGH